MDQVDKMPKIKKSVQYKKELNVKIKHRFGQRDEKIKQRKEVKPPIIYKKLKAETPKFKSQGYQNDFSNDFKEPPAYAVGAIF